MDQKDCEKHIRECFEEGKKPVDVWGDKVVAIVQRRRDEVRRASEWNM
jgi:hypothetical protein